MQMNMNLYELTKKYGEGKGEDTMWATLAIVSDAVEAVMTEPEKDALVRKVYGVMSGKHYNEDFAREDISKMYYVDKNGVKHYAPYWSDDLIREVYNKHKAEIPEYNCWDFAVALNMSRADNHNLLLEWFPDNNEQELDKKMVELSLNWLNDPDNPYHKSKIWCYLNNS